MEDIENLEQIEAELAKQLETPVKLNRKQRRALLKKGGKKGRQQLDAVTETAKKLNYIDLIQKLQELNKKREEEDNAGTSEED